MQKIKELFDTIIKNDNWRTEMITHINNRIEKHESTYDACEDFLSNLSNKYVEDDNPEKTKEELSKLLNDDELLDIVHEFILKINIWYFDVKILRSLQKMNPYLVFSVLDIILENYVVHLDDLCVEKIQSIISEYEFEYEQIEKCLRAIDYKAEYYVCEFLSKTFISNEFSEDSGLEKNYADYFAELVMKYEKDIKINFIVKKLKQVKL